MLVRRHPGLLDRVPPGRSVRWPYYQGDLVIRVDPTNAIERKMLAGYDADLSQALNRFLAVGAHCIDVGANVGPVSLLMAKLVGPSGRVLAVEPGVPFVERLRWNLEANPVLKDRVVILMVGMSDAEGTLVWRPDPEHPFNAGLSAVHCYSVVNELNVPVTTLDAAVARQGWGRVDFIKIDVEGMELEVLRGARHTLETRRPVVLFETLEFFRALRRERTGDADVFAEIGRLLEGVRYRLCELQPDGRLRGVITDALPANTLAIPVEWQG